MLGRVGLIGTTPRLCARYHAKTFGLGVLAGSCCVMCEKGREGFLQCEKRREEEGWRTTVAEFGFVAGCADDGEGGRAEEAFGREIHGGRDSGG